MQVDANEARVTADEELYDQEYYGQLEHILHLRIPPATIQAFDNKRSEMRTALLRKHRPVPVILDENGIAADHILVSIRNSRLSNEVSGLEGLDIHYTTTLAGPLHVVDAISLQCLVGRVHDGRHWAFIDRSGNLVRTAATD